MVMFELAFIAVAEVIAGAIGALVLALLCWNLFKLVLHPEWGPCLAFGLVVVALCAPLRMDRILPLIAIFSLIAAVCTWPEGAEWRKRRSAQSPLARHPPRAGSGS